MVLARARTSSARVNGARSAVGGGVAATVIRLVVRSTVWSLASSYIIVSSAVARLVFDIVSK
jgi:hypothetical protein